MTNFDALFDLPNGEVKRIWFVPDRQREDGTWIGELIVMDFGIPGPKDFLRVWPHTRQGGNSDFPFMEWTWREPDDDELIYSRSS